MPVIYLYAFRVGIVITVHLGCCCKALVACVLPCVCGIVPLTFNMSWSFGVPVLMLIHFHARTASCHSWPALLARAAHFKLLNLGFGGAAGRVSRASPVDRSCFWNIWSSEHDVTSRLWKVCYHATIHITDNWWFVVSCDSG